MYARIAAFESDPANVEQAIEVVRSSVESEGPRRASRARRCSCW
jgi:hypothetical protein